MRRLETHFYFNVADLVHGPDRRSAHHRGEDEGWEVAAGISALDELKLENEAVCYLAQPKDCTNLGRERRAALTPVPLSQTITLRPWLSISAVSAVLAFVFLRDFKLDVGKFCDWVIQRLFFRAGIDETGI